MLYERLKPVIEKTGIKVYGYLPEMKECSLKKPSSRAFHARGDRRPERKNRTAGRADKKKVWIWTDC